jgi:hypothetical protein
VPCPDEISTLVESDADGSAKVGCCPDDFGVDVSVSNNDGCSFGDILKIGDPENARNGLVFDQIIEREVILMGLK